MRLEMRLKRPPKGAGKGGVINFSRNYCRSPFFKKLLQVPVFSIFLLFAVGELAAQHFYEREEVLRRLDEKREVIPLVKLEPDRKNPDLESFEMAVAAVAKNTPYDKAFVVLTDYSRFEKIAPDQIDRARVIVSATEDPLKPVKYLHFKAKIPTLFKTYRLEMFLKLHEKLLDDKGVVKWESMSGSVVGIKNPGSFVGMKGTIETSPFYGVDGKRRDPPSTLIVLTGALSREEFSSIVPSFVLNFALSVALQRAAIVIRNHIETTKDIPPRRLYGVPETGAHLRLPDLQRDIHITESLQYLLEQFSD